ncbi:DUF72 domain-containing protein [Rhizobium sp. Leaf371]|uniref:DUF72 domain-containing protein n=1 Tax=Rhizobium sp. Leaf371 TaxID=1736355 RepID=UPI001FCD4041|nr:DUF72 domain-containing protein [Rhizobium sp. Leaf371]
MCRRVQGAEVNSTFSRHHRASTHVRWAASGPDAFRFALKTFRSAFGGRLAIAFSPTRHRSGRWRRSKRRPCI